MVNNKALPRPNPLCSLGKIGQFLNSAPQAPQVIQDIRDELRAVLPVASISIAKYEATTGGFDWLLRGNLDSDELTAIEKRMLLRKQIEHSPESSSRPRKLQVLAIPMVFENEVVGLMHAKSPRGVAFSETDEAFLVAVAAHLTTAFRDTAPVASEHDVLKEKLEEAENKNRKLLSIIEIARSIAHEFNQPLTGISGYCTLILEELESETNVLDDVAEIKKQAKRLENLVHKFQNIAHVEYLEDIRLHY